MATAGSGGRSGAADLPARCGGRCLDVQGAAGGGVRYNAR